MNITCLCKKLHKIISFILYWLTLLHECCHALVTYAFIKNKSVKPVIVIGNYDTCVGHKPNNSIFIFDVYYYDVFTIKKYFSTGNKGITLHPAYNSFSKCQIRLCAAVGWMFDLILTFVLLLPMILYCNWIIKECFFLGVILLVICFLGIILLIIKSSDFKITCKPHIFKTKTIKIKYYRLVGIKP